jgi:hypothetical protein
MSRRKRLEPSAGFWYRKRATSLSACHPVAVPLGARKTVERQALPEVASAKEATAAGMPGRRVSSMLDTNSGTLARFPSRRLL